MSDGIIDVMKRKETKQLELVNFYCVTEYTFFYRGRPKHKTTQAYALNLQTKSFFQKDFTGLYQKHVLLLVNNLKNIISSLPTSSDGSLILMIVWSAKLFKIPSNKYTRLH